MDIPGGVALAQMNESFTLVVDEAAQVFGAHGIRRVRQKQTESNAKQSSHMSCLTMPSGLFNLSDE